MHDTLDMTGVAGKNNNNNRKMGDNVDSYRMEDFFALINHPRESVANDVRDKIKEQFHTTNDKYVVNGLLDYFFATNRLLSRFQLPIPLSSITAVLFRTRTYPWIRILGHGFRTFFTNDRIS